MSDRLIGAPSLGATYKVPGAVSRLQCRCFALTILLAAAPANAAERSPASGSAQAQADHVAPSAALSDGSGQLTPLPAAELSAYRGGATIVSGTQTLGAVTTGNVLTGGFVGGSVVLSDNALANFNGVGNIAINTGAQVSLQSAMNLTINIAP